MTTDGIFDDTNYWLLRFADILEVIDAQQLTAEDLAPLTLHLEYLHERNGSPDYGVRPIDSTRPLLTVVAEPCPQHGTGPAVLGAT
ncbi:UNVERIFIED_CONTAM: hypothetical protein DES50_101594 [Williamsia faeni]